MHVFAQCLNDMILSRYKYYFCVEFLDGGKWKKHFVSHHVVGYYWFWRFTRKIKSSGSTNFLNEFIQPVFSYTRASLSAESKKYTWGSPISDITKIEATKRLSGIRTMFTYSQFCKALSRLRRDIFRYFHKGRKHTFRIKHSPFNLISDSQLPIS